MGRFSIIVSMAITVLAASACTEQGERIADLFRWGERQPKHEGKKAEPKAAEDMDMSNMTVPGLKKRAMKMVEIPPNAIFISSEQQYISGIRFGRVEFRNLQNVIWTVGRLQYDEKRIFTVNPKIGGWIDELYVDYTGKMVRKGQPLLTIYSPELVSAQEEVLLALKTKKILSSSSITDVGFGGDSLLQGARKRLLLWDITPKQIETLEKTGEIKKNMLLYAPADGFVMEKTAFKGMAFTPGMVLYKIGDLSSVWLLADIYEYQLPFVKVGDKAKINLAYFPGEFFEGTATYIYPSVDPKTRTIKVRFDLPNLEFKLKPDMWANVELELPLGRMLSVPGGAVIDTGTMQMVYVDLGQGYFEPRHIQVGTRVPGLFEVKSGLREGERVVTSGIFLVDAASHLAGGMAGHQHGSMEKK